METLTTYTVKSKNSAAVWVFKYHLNGTLNEFKVLEGVPTETQFNWLFRMGNFPYFEAQIKEWQTKLKANFEMTVGEPDLSFENFWNIWGLKVKRDGSEKAWNKLSDADKIKCFLNYKKYQDHLIRTGQAKAHLVTWLNGKRYNDEY